MADTAGTIPDTDRIYQPSPVKRRPDPQITACLELLAEMFPRAFALHEVRRWPLKVGIHQDIIAALGGAVTVAELGRALRVYTTNKRYRARLRVGTPRVDLNGEPAGTAEQVPGRIGGDA